MKKLKKNLNRLKILFKMLYKYFQVEFKPSTFI